MAEIRLTLVTLAYNNLPEVKKTLASIALQETQPDRILVVDSSAPGQKEEIEKLAELVSADYFWVEPRGVYPAMNYALGEVLENSFVWFINSSDWLAGPGSVSRVKEILSPGTSWLIGGLQRLGDKKNPYHPIPTGGETFVDFLSTGRIGFPHPSAIIAESVIREAGGFDTSLKIAADYKLALSVASETGPPSIIDRTLAVHVPTGLTSRHKARHAIEKLQARFSEVQSHNLWKEIRAQLATLSRLFWAGSLEDRRLPTEASEQYFGVEIDNWPEES